MRIVIHALSVHPARVGGAETYIRRLLEALQEIDRQNEYLVITSRDSDLQLVAPNFRRIDCQVDPTAVYWRVLWEQVSLVRLLWKLRPDLVHFPASTAPFLFHGPSVVTIHDTLRFQYPSSKRQLLQRYYDWNQRGIARSGKHVVAVSHADAAVMARHLGLPSSRLSVIPLGVDRLFHTAEDHASRAPGDYLLWVGRWYPHKNIEMLAAAYQRLRSEGFQPPPFRVVGLAPTEQSRFSSLLKQMGVADLFQLRPPMPHSELPAVYRGARLLCAPSSVESFGLPILEAMACGTPVICSDLPAFREIFGDCASYFSVGCVTEFAARIKELLTDDARWRELSRRGRDRVLAFTWRRCAEQTLATYRRVASVLGRPKEPGDHARWQAQEAPLER